MEAYGWFDEQWGKARDTEEYHLEGLDLAIGEKILEILEKKEIPKEELAKRLAIAPATLSRWINEPSRLTLRKLLMISRALGCRLDVQFQDE